MAATLSPRRITGSRCFLEGRGFVLSTYGAAPTARIGVMTRGVPVREGGRTINDVLDAVAKHYGITREQVVSERAPVPFRARRIALHLACRVTQRSLPQIGAGFGGVSSTNVLFAKHRIERDMSKDAELAAEVEGIKASLLIK